MAIRKTAGRAKRSERQNECKDSAIGESAAQEVRICKWFVIRGSFCFRLFANLSLFIVVVVCVHV